MAAIAAQPHHHYQQHLYPSQSVMEDASDDDDHGDHDHDMDEDDDESIEGDLIDPAHAHFYHQQQQQALYYQQHQQQHGSSDSVGGGAGPSRQNSAQQQQGLDDDDGAYSDEESDTDSMPDENIDFSLTYALHTFLATVEGQASVVKGDSLVLLDDANSYWWLVRVLKTEDVGYIPAENIETPYERLARLNKHRNVDLAAATNMEKQAGTVQGRDKLKGLLAGKAKGLRRDHSGEVSEEGAGRRVVFAPPTYVDHPGVTWSSDEDDSGDEGEMDVDEVERESSGHQQGQEAHRGDVRHEAEVHQVEQSLRPDAEMEPDDGIEWADEAAAASQRRMLEQKQRQNQQAPASNSAGSVIQPKSNNPFAPRQEQQTNHITPSASNTSLASTSGGSVILDPAQASGDTRRITATPAVASGPLLPSALQQQQQQQQQHGGQRNVSGQSVNSVSSAISTNSSQRSGSPASPEEIAKKGKKMKKGSKEDLHDGDKKKRGMLGGLFHRKGKDKSGKGLSGNEARSSEESMISGAAETSPVTQGRWSEDNNGRGAHTSLLGPRGSEVQQQQPQQQQAANGVSAHSLRLQQQDQARMQSYTSKYLNKSPSSELHSPTTAEAAAAVAQSAAAMRLAASMNGNPTGNAGRPSSVILSPNPAGPPLLNVIRIFAGDHIKSESSFKTALVNETTSSADLIRQAMQRFQLPGGSNANLDQTYYITVRDVNGEELELTPDEKPLTAFQEAVKRWARESDEDLTTRMGAITPTVKRSSVSSISSVVSLSSHPAIAKLGLNDFSDDSVVKIYFNRRRPGSAQMNGPNGAASQPQNGMPEPASEFSSYSTQLSTVQESSPENKSGEWAQAGSPDTSTDTATPPMQAQQRFNPSLTISTNGQASPERYSSPSARFTVQLIIHANDLPDGSAFDPSSDAIIPRSLLRDRQAAPVTEPRRRVFILPRNANVVEAIEQGLERFGINEGVVDGGDDVEDKVGKRRSMARVRYSLAVMIHGEEHPLASNSRILDSYDQPPNFRPMERTTPEQRRRSRDLQHNAGSPADLLPSDPVFVLRRVGQRGLSSARIDITSTPRQTRINGDTRSPAEIIAAQRAASRANQKALISSQTNMSQGVDVVLPDQKGTFRSSRLMEADGEVVRYSYIDGDGETYDISELLEEEWGKDGSVTGSISSLAPHQTKPPTLARMTTDQSAYITAPSTPDEGLEKDRALSAGLSLAAPATIFDSKSQSNSRNSSSRISGEGDILKGVVQMASGQEDKEKLEEKLNRVIERVKNGSIRGSTSSDEVALSTVKSQNQAQTRSQHDAEQERDQQSHPQAQGRRSSEQSMTSSASHNPSRQNSAASSGRSTPQGQAQHQSHGYHTSLPDGKASIASSSTDINATPRASSQYNNGNGDSQGRSLSHQGYDTTAASVNRIISRHRQQPSIASIISMSDVDHSNGGLQQSHHAQRHENAQDRRQSGSVDGGDDTETDDVDRDGNSTPVTATSSSTHPTPPFSGAVFTRAIGSISPTPSRPLNGPVRYKDDFGIKEMMAVISARAGVYTSPRLSRTGIKGKLSRNSGKITPNDEKEEDSMDEEKREEHERVNSLLDGEKVDWEYENIHPDIKGCFEGVAKRLEDFDREIDDLLAQVGGHSVAAAAAGSG
ncbi:hypothetical protein I317_00175 [Kwoniella heveanensis CBS 569]|nr:hypothetical protein I317_00175 [Kwoniella heveanensis CBS 569]